MEFESQWSAKMPQGLDLEISHHPLTMRRVVNLVVAMERLKTSKSEFSCSTEFRDEDLLNMIVESALEEQIVLELTSEPTDEVDGAFFIKTRDYPCKVTDRKKRNLVLMEEVMELHSVMLQAGNTSHIAYLNMTNYIDPARGTNARPQRPVTLSIKGTNFYLSCKKDDGTPTLQLEELEDKAQLRRINRNSDMVRFIFFRQDTGRDATTLMSAQFDGWYISTAVQNNMPVDMCQESSDRYQTFTVEHQN